MPAFDLGPPVEEASPFSSTSLLQLSCSWRQSSRRAMNEVWNLGPQTPSAAGGRSGSICRLREACLSTPQPLRHRVPCVPFVGAGYPRCSRPTRSRTTGLVRWYPLGQLEEELDPVARTGDQVVEVLHFMGGEDSPRRVLCPWRAHRLASTLPAVARATAVCFLRCECLRGR